MSYDEQVWIDFPDTSTPISADRLAHMEAGIAAAHAGSILGITVPYWPDDPTNPRTIFHNDFWPLGVDLGPCYYEAFVRHDTNAQYIWSDGAGGAHGLLAGFGGSTPTGNIWDGTTVTSFTGWYIAEHAEWLRYTFCWNGTMMFVLVNNMVVAIKPFAGPRRAQYGQFFVGGSNHSNWVGCIAWQRGWEGQMPTDLPWLPIYLQTDRYPSDRWPNGPVCQVGANYLDPVDTYPDFGDGFNGSHHPGVSRGQQSGFESDHPNQPHPVRVIDLTAPFGGQINAARTRVSPTPVSAPIGSKVWDSFGRADSIPDFTAVPTLGSTEGGSLGVQAWQHAAGEWGTFCGMAYCGNENRYARVTGDSADQDVRVGRFVDTASGFYYGVAAARIKADLSSGWVLRYRNTTEVVLIRPDSTTAGTYTATAGRTMLRLTTSGTTITAYTDDGGFGWTQIGQVTGETANQTEVGAGMYVTYGIGSQGYYPSFELR